jgi:hypothetical protein
MPLLRMAARTAVVAGTATAVSNRVSRRQANRWAQQGQSQPAYLQPQPPYPQQGYPQQGYPQQGYAQPVYAPPPPPAVAPPPPANDTVTQLKQLAELKDQGILTDEEFASQKAKVLAAS